MLGKMIVHGLVAAALIGSVAAIYSQAKADSSALSPAPAALSVLRETSPDTPTARVGKGYIQPVTSPIHKAAKHEKKHGKRKHLTRHNRHRLHSDTDDDD